MGTTIDTDDKARKILVLHGHFPDATGKYWGYSAKWDEYGYLTAAELLDQVAPFRCRECGTPTRNPALCIDCVNDAEAGDIPY
jgi:hypothetical protein